MPPPPAGAPSGTRAREASRHGSELLALLERRLGLTSIGLLTLAIIPVGWFAARLAQRRGLFLLVYGVAFVLLVAWLLGRRKLAVAAARSALPTRVREGREVPVVLELTARRRISTIILEEHLPEHLGAPVRVPVPLLPAGDTVSHPYTFTPRLRGIYRVGPLVAEWNDPFGLTRSRETLCDAVEIIVHPSLEQAADRVTSREWEDPPVRPPIFKPWPTGFEFYGMRDYVDGDDPRRIVWRAVAQYDKYLVRESEQGITDRVNIVLDTDLEGHSPGPVSDTFERAVRATSSLAVKHLEDGFAVTIDGNGGQLVKNLRGVGKRIPLLDSMAGVQMEKATLSTALDRLFVGAHRNAHNVVITPYLSPHATGRLRVLRERGVSLLVVLVLWDETEPATLHRAGSLGCNIVELHPGSSLARVFEHVVGGRR